MQEKKKVLVCLLLLLAVLGGTGCAYGTVTKGTVFFKQTAYRGTIYTPFSLLPPSSYSSFSGSSDGAWGDYSECQEVPKRNIRKSSVTFAEEGWTKSADTGKSTRSTPTLPIGGSWLLALACLLYACRKRRVLAAGACLVAVQCSATTVEMRLESVALQSGKTIIATPVVDTAPSPSLVCWDLYYDKACTHLVPGVTFNGMLSGPSANSVSFTVPEAGTYFLQVLIRDGSSCSSSVRCASTYEVTIYPGSADRVLTRSMQRSGNATQLTDKTENSTVIGVMQFDKDAINDGSVSPYERYNYFFSLPFDVRVGDISGIGSYGQHWLIEYYDGLRRAQNGYWADSEPNWKRIDDTDSILHAYQGYLLKLNSLRMAADQTDVWHDGSDVASLYFPSLEAVDLTRKDETIPALGESHRCTINIGGEGGDRRIEDSFWRCIGVPGEGGYTTDDIAYFYVWDTDDNSLVVTSGTGYAFKPMHAYLIQQQGSIVWRAGAPASVAARTMQETGFTMQLDIKRNGVSEDHTLVRLSEAEETIDRFAFGEDLCKEYNTGKANIYTFTRDSIRVAGNTMPMSEQKTVVPVGVKIATEGEYTFAIPEGTEGVGVVLVDKVTGTRTNLGLTDYTVWLEAGTCDARFEIEISPVQNTPTGIDNSQFTIHNSQCVARKVLIDGVLYIIRDGKVYDATGNSQFTIHN